MHRHETSSTKKVKSRHIPASVNFEVENESLLINPFDNSKRPEKSKPKWFSVRHLSAFLRSTRHTKKLIGICIILLIISTLFIYLCVKDKDIDYDKVVITPNGHKIIYTRFKQQKQCPEKSSGVLEQEKKIFQSVRKEHIELIEKFNQATVNLETITKEIPVKEAELKELELKIEELRLLQRELNDRRNVKLSLPHSPLYPPKNRQRVIGDAENSTKVFTDVSSSFRTLEDSIDYSRCSISSLFQVYVYDTSVTAPSAINLWQELKSNAASTKQANQACLFVAVIENTQNVHKQLNGFFTAKAAIAVASKFAKGSFRPCMDVSVHLQVPAYDILEYERLPQLLPHSRVHLLSYMTSDVDSFSLDLNCSQTAQFNLQKSTTDLCYDHQQRLAFIRRSFFSLIFPDSSSFQERFYEALLAGCVPVIVSMDSNDQSLLPFQDLIDWRLAVVRIPPARLASELHFILRSIKLADLVEMRRKGRFFLENYLLNTKVLSQSILSTLRFRLQIPDKGQFGVVGQEFPAKNYSFNPLVGVTRPPFDDEYLGPVEAPFASVDYAHNMTAFGLYAYKQWNELPFHVTNTPAFMAEDSPLPSEAEFSEETSLGMRPIAPGSGQEFALALGGNRPREQFTIVITTYNRDAVLAASLERLHKLPYLNKVLVVWNNIDRAPSGIWPRLHVPVVFINTSKNSLNNRFIPYEQIETEGVLSLDDDIDLRQHEIIFAFRTWREQRQRIVGFPARYHARYGESMHYNSNHTCQFSMILTGAAFCTSHICTLTLTQCQVSFEKK
uniref:Exostosin-3 n=1 Tax=Ditylenchus dipsaci TaxID=166011 RepID=A0A915CW53_9BILA